MFRKPAFWVVFVLGSIACTVWAALNFSRAFPLVTIDLRMDRHAATAEAERLASERGWGPEDASTAVAYRLDGTLQSFVELEGGGKPAWREMLEGELFSPYTWTVRRFREGETNESTLRFRPDGRPYGFREKIPEDEPGANLEPEAARELAEAAVAAGWEVELGDYELVEQSHEVRPGGRTDHVLVYERPGLEIGDEGRYRLRLTVSGDRFTELTHFVKIPEAFSRRYQEMRSANDAIATGSMFAIAILYVALGCVAGLFFLMRERWVIWKPALKWAVFIAGLQALVVLNRWPLLWMGYDTAISPTTYALQQVGAALAQLVGMGAVLALSFMAAESLGRRAFPHHVQLWRAWSPGVASSPTLLGQTIGGYLLIGIFFAYEVWLYFFASEHLGWWTPSSALIDPNVLANVFPWLTSIAISLQAGFWEECLFRAVPLASAALLGRRFGRPWAWIAAAMVLQAVIFGAGHANYPAQPAYARVLELIIPALGFGGLYLVFGLVPAIIFHFAFDVVWFAMPLFAASTPGIWIDRVLVIILTLVPLWIVLRSRWRAGRWSPVPEAERNAGWQPPPPTLRATRPAPTTTPGLTARRSRVLTALGVAGLIAWAVATDFRTEAPPLESGDGEARVAAREVLAERGFEPSGEWRELSTVQAPRGLADRFVWQEGGRDRYRELLGRYLPTPRWLVRYARFEGDVAERREEWSVYVDPGGNAQRVAHALPEGRPGASLEEDEARALARENIAAEYGLAGGAIEEVSADPSRLPERRDWNFVFKDVGGYPMDDGEARISVDIAGDEVVACGRYIHIPEEWERDQRRRRSVSQIVQIAGTVLVVLVYLTGAVVAIIRWSRHRFATTTFVLFFAFLAVAGAIRIGNGFRSGSASFDTAVSFQLQAAIVIAGGLLATTAIAAAVALLIGLAHRWLPSPATVPLAPSLAAGFGTGAALAALGAVGMRFAPSSMPPWPSFSGAAAWSPVVDTALGTAGSWITGTALFLFLVAVAHVLSQGWTRRRPLTLALLVAFGLVVTGSDGVESLALWLVEGALTGAVLAVVWTFVLRLQPALTPVVTAAGTVLSGVESAVIGAFPGAAAGSIIGVMLVVAAAVWWLRRIAADTAMVEPTINAPAADAGGPLEEAR